jgi:hypothetical protein
MTIVAQDAAIDDKQAEQTKAWLSLLAGSCATTVMLFAAAMRFERWTPSTIVLSVDVLLGATFFFSANCGHWVRSLLG